MDFGGLHELMASPEEMVSRLDGWAWGETGKFFEPRERPQPIVYCLSRNVLRLWMRRLKNLTRGFLGKTRGHANSHREHVGRQLVWESHRRPVVALDSPGCIWPAVGLGAGTLQPRPSQPPIIQ